MSGDSNGKLSDSAALETKSKKRKKLSETTAMESLIPSPFYQQQHINQQTEQSHRTAIDTHTPPLPNSTQQFLSSSSSYSSSASFSSSSSSSSSSVASMSLSAPRATWTEEQEAALVDACCVYSEGLKQKTNRRVWTKILAAMEEKKMKITTLQAQSKWKNLKKQYREDLRKMKENPRFKPRNSIKVFDKIHAAFGEDPHNHLQLTEPYLPVFQTAHDDDDDDDEELEDGTSSPHPTHTAQSLPSATEQKKEEKNEEEEEEPKKEMRMSSAKTLEIFEKHFRKMEEIAEKNSQIFREILAVVKADSAALTMIARAAATLLPPNSQHTSNERKE